MNASLRRSFTIHHWPALREWDVTPIEFDLPAARFSADETDAGSGLLGALSYCLRLSPGQPTSVVIEYGAQRYEFHLASPMADE